jgi:hypothetical protein
MWRIIGVNKRAEHLLKADPYSDRLMSHPKRK